jgi:uncharacterized OB-fold protein
MPKMSPVPDGVSQGFWDACNEERLVVQSCNSCSWLQHPPKPECYNCGSADSGWRDMNGRGKIHGYCIMSDSRIRALQELRCLATYQAHR